MVSEKVKDKILQYVFYIVYNLNVKIIPKINIGVNRFIYTTQEKLDPSPPKKKKEADKDWYKRIDIKYALRHAKFFRLYTTYLSLVVKQRLTFGLLEGHPKSFQKKYKELVSAVNETAYKCEENYNMLLVRQRVEDVTKND